MVKKTFLTLGLLSIVASGVLAETTFTYQTYGGFSDKVGAITPNPSDHYNGALDGPWHREGNFTKSDGTVTDTDYPWGDQDTTDPYNKKDMRSLHNLGGGVDPDYLGLMWPALSWGHKKNEDIKPGDEVPYAADPWVVLPPNPEGLGGMSGLGLTGYGYPKEGGFHTITVGDNSKLAPMGSFTHVNSSLTFVGSMQATLGWNVALSDALGPIDDAKPVRHYHFTLTQWETYSGSTPCPRGEPDGTPIIDTEWNDDPAHSVPASFWDNMGKSGLDNTFYSDGVSDPEGLCSDPFGFSYLEDADGDKLEITSNGLRDTFVNNSIKYEILYSGFWQNHTSIEGCVETNYGQDANWSIACFDQHPTLWSKEQAKNVGYVRMQINEVDTNGCTPGYWKQFKKQHPWPAQPEGSSIVATPDTPFNEVFECYAEFNPGYTLGEAIALGGGGTKALSRHAVAALLNIRDSGVNYVYTDEQDLINRVCNAWNDPESFKDELERANEDNCPL